MWIGKSKEARTCNAHESLRILYWKCRDWIASKGLFKRKNILVRTEYINVQAET